MDFSAIQNIVSVEFMLFAIGAVILYYIVPKKFRWCTLIVANTLFYVFAGGALILYVLAATAAAYGFSMWTRHLYQKQDLECEGLDRKEKKPIKQKYNKLRKYVLALSLVIVLGGLVVVKYTPFLAENFNIVLGWIGINRIDTKGINLPEILGCSYFTLAIVAYLTDVYRGKFTAETNPLKLFVFVSFFPHIKLGPIERYDYLAPQLFEGNKFKFQNLKTGAMLILWGVFKQLMITNRLSKVSAYIFGNYESLNGITILFGTVVFSIQIYTNWTTYCDIVGGVAEMMGIKITKNFDHPYFSKTMPEFWRRWHISMGTFFKDYILYPVSSSAFCLKLNKNSRKLFGNTAGRVISSALPILSVWLVTGLWHGANYNFMMWGLFQGVIILLSVIFTPMFEKTNKLLNFKTETFGWSLFRMIRTFFICCMGRIFFNTSTISDAFGMFKRLTVLSGGFPLMSFGLDKKDWIIAAISVIVLIAVSAMGEKFDVRKKLDEQPIIFKWIVLYILIMSIVIFGVYGPESTFTGFVYEDF